LRPFSAELGVHDGVVHALVFCQLEDPPRALAGLDQGLDLWVVDYSGVHNVVTGNPESVIAEDPWLAQLVVRLLHRGPRQLRCNDPVDVQTDDIAWLDLACARNIVGCEYLLRQGHASPSRGSVVKDWWWSGIAVLVVECFEVSRYEELDLGFLDFIESYGGAQTESTKVPWRGAMPINLLQRVRFSRSPQCL
jgi:hypothetical protein